MDVNPQLVEKITKAVLAALARQADEPRTSLPGDMGGRAPDAAALRQPTGPAPLRAAAPALAAGPALTGVVTAKRLAGLEGTIYLAPGARLSPLAQDLVKQRGLRVQAIAANEMKKSDAEGSSWLYWMQGHCPSALRVIEQFRGRLLEGIQGTSGEQLPAVIRSLNRIIAGGRGKLAVLFVPAAAPAICLANRCANLRAVVGTGRRAVQEGIDLLGANVLVLEYPQHGFLAMAELMELFLISSGAAPAPLQRQLAQLAACR